MRRRVRFYSDDSYSGCPSGRKNAVVAGVAIASDRTDINRELIRAERLSGKGLRDWHKTPRLEREKYLSLLWDIQAIRDRVFFRAFDGLANDQLWAARVDALVAAINTFTPGYCHHQMAHDGLKSSSRYGLRLDLRKRGCSNVTVETAQFVAEPEVRLSDALAGYIRGELYVEAVAERSMLTNIPDDFVRL